MKTDENEWNEVVKNEEIDEDEYKLQEPEMKIVGSSSCLENLTCC